MDIIKLKDGGLLLKTKGADIALDPLLKGTKLPADAASADFGLSTKPEAELQTYGESGRFFSWPGEYEVKGVAVHAHPVAENDQKTQNPLLFVIYSDFGKICYLPEIKAELHSDLIEAIGDVDLLVFPASGSDKIWHSTIEEIEPKAILPVTYPDSSISIDAFLSKLGQAKPEATDKVSIKNKSDLRIDQISIFLLS